MLDVIFKLFNISYLSNFMSYPIIFLLIFSIISLFRRLAHA